MNKLKALVKIIITPHNPRNVVMFLFHKLLNSRLVVAGYRSFVLPVVVKRVTKKNRIRVVFLPMNCAMWRYGEIYEKMRDNPRFEPMIVTAPRIIQPRESYAKEQREMVSYFNGKGYSVIQGYDEKNKKWISLAELKPDVIFYTQPYDGLVPSEFEYWHNLSSLICYTPYSFQFSRVGWNWDNAVQNYAWRHFLSLPEHVSICREFSRIKAQNSVAVGYFFEEEYKRVCEESNLINKTWKNDIRKRVIWAPHHSIIQNEEFKTSSFLDICDDMLALRNQYSDCIIFAFKPHPMLLDNLYKVWGKEKTDAYYANWANSHNSFFDDGAFIPLFAGSDAMIHCSGSFIVDYMYTGKPVQYVYCKDRVAPDFGKIGRVSLESHYIAHTIEDIRSFIDNVVLANNDNMRSKRESIYLKHLKSHNGKTFSENVTKTIMQGLSR